MKIADYLADYLVKLEKELKKSLIGKWLLLKSKTFYEGLLHTNRVVEGTIKETKFVIRNTKTKETCDE